MAALEPRAPPRRFTAATEIGFFSGAGKFAKGAEWYATQFEGWAGERIVGEATPAYMMYRHDPKVVAARIRSFDEEMRLRRCCATRWNGHTRPSCTTGCGAGSCPGRASSSTSAARRPRTTGSTSSPAGGTTHRCSRSGRSSVINSVLMQDDVEDRAREGVRPGAGSHLRAARVSGRPTSTPCASATGPGSTGSVARGLRGADRRRSGRAVRVLPRRHRPARGDARLQPRPLAPRPRSGHAGRTAARNRRMFPFWETSSHRSSRPPVRGASSRSGRCGARTPSSMLERLGPGRRAARHRPGARTSTRPSTRRRFPGRYVFHRDLSLDVLPATCRRWTPPSIDGDHNWYTVYNELRLLARGGPRRRRAAARCWSSTTCCWPYGRRDLYYDPERASPRSSASRTQRAGMQPGPREAPPRGGMNRTLANAEPRAGPATA